MSELAASQNKQAAMHCLGHRELLDRIADRSVEFRWAKDAPLAPRGPARTAEGV
jgi:hypothetical protein